MVDDTSTVRSLLKRAVTRMGQGVDTACTGEVGGSQGGASPAPKFGGGWLATVFTTGFATGFWKLGQDAFCFFVRIDRRRR